MNKARRYIQIRSGGRVERLHCNPHIGIYNNATHQWNVAILMAVLWPEVFGRLALICLTHDVPESWTGDFPAPVKRYNPRVAAEMELMETRLAELLELPTESSLGKEDLAKLKFCDRLEFWIWCKEQAKQGNMFVLEPLTEITKYLDEAEKPAGSEEFWHQLRHGEEQDLQPQQAHVIQRIMQELQHTPDFDRMRKEGNTP